MSTSSQPQNSMAKLQDLFRNVRAAAERDGDSVHRFRNNEEELQGIKDEHFLSKIKILEQTLLNLSALEDRLRMIILKAENTHSSADAKALFDSSVLDLVERNVDQIKVAVGGVRSMLPTRQTDPAPAQPAKFGAQLAKLGSQPAKLGAQPGKLGAGRKMSEEFSRLHLEDRVDSTEFSEIRRSYDDLESTELKMCCLSLSIFPDGSVMKKRPLIYWWIGEGFVASTQEKTAEEVGEEIFEKLLTVGFTQPHLDESRVHLDEYGGVMKGCKVHPWIRRLLIFFVKEAGGVGLFHFDPGWARMPSYDPATCKRACLTSNNPTFKGSHEGDDLITVFNVNNQFLSMERGWLNKLRKVGVLQLGRWQHSAAYQIEVTSDKFLRGLGAQKHLKYLSLRGISRITDLPSSILNLGNLEILDLRACHHLANLPSDISRLKKLTHLDVSECYFLASMPKGLDQLSSLQVLKGHVMRDSSRTPCKISELYKLENLRRLSIHIGNEAEVNQGDFATLEKIISLRRLKISWAVVSENSKAHIVEESSQLSFPADLEKLDLQGIPLAQVPKLLQPSKLKNLQKLYIRGGKLDSLDHAESDDKWAVELLRLKYLSHLKIELPELKKMFPCLRYVEKIKCHEIEKEKYSKDIVWDSDEQSEEVNKSVIQSS